MLTILLMMLLLLLMMLTIMTGDAHDLVLILLMLF